MITLAMIGNLAKRLTNEPPNLARTPTTTTHTKYVNQTSSKNYRYSTNLQVAIDASTRLVIALGGTARQPQRHDRLPHLRH